MQESTVMIIEFNGHQEGFLLTFCEGFLYEILHLVRASIRASVRESVCVSECVSVHLYVRVSTSGIFF